MVLAGAGQETKCLLVGWWIGGYGLVVIPKKAIKA